MSDQVRTVSGPFMDLRLFRAAVAYPEVEFKTVGGLFMNLRLFRAAIAITEVEVRAVSDPVPQFGTRHAPAGRRVATVYDPEVEKNSCCQEDPSLSLVGMPKTFITKVS